MFCSSVNKILNINLQVRLFDFFEKEAAEEFLCNHIHCVSKGKEVSTQVFFLAIFSVLLTGN